MGPPPFALVESKVFFPSFLRSDGDGGLPERKKKKRNSAASKRQSARRWHAILGWRGEIFLSSGVFLLLASAAANEGGGVQEDSAMDAAGIKKRGGGNRKFVRRSSDWGAPMDWISPGLLRPTASWFLKSSPLSFP